MESYDPTNAVHRATIRKVSWHIIPFMLLMYAFSYLDRINIGTAALTMNKDLGLTQTEFGFAAGIFFVGYLIFEIPSNLVMARVGGRIWLPRIMISWGIVSALTGFVQNATQLSIARVALGVAEAGSFPGMMYFIALWFPREMRGRVLILSSLPIAVVFGTPVSTSILQYMDGMFGLAGWRLLFIFEGLPPILLGLAMMKYLTPRPSEASWLSPVERQWLSERVLGPERRDVNDGTSVWDVMRNPQVLVFSLAYAGLMMGFTANLFFTPQIISAFGALVGVKLSYMQIGLLTSLPSCFAVVISYNWARHSDKTGERVWHAAFGAIGAGVGVILLAHSSGFAMLLFGLVLLGGCIGGGAASIWQLPTRGMSDRAAAIAFAFVNSIAVICSSVIPYLIGALRDATGSYDAGLYVIVGILALSAVLVLLGGKVLESPKATVPIAPTR